jgi:hypothetical protein
MGYEFVIIIGLLVLGWGLIGLFLNDSPEQEKEVDGPVPEPDPSGEEWPVVAESNNETDIYPLKSLLDSNDIPALVETETPNTVEGAMSAIRNRLRVKPDKRSEAEEILKEHGQEKFLVG